MSQDIKDWTGRREVKTDVLHATPARFMQATLGEEPSLGDSDTLPPSWHWMYFLEARPLGELGRDGHPKKGGFLPPVELPRRMWAGGRLRFHAPLLLGKGARKDSEITKISEKTGKSGQLVFVTVEHKVFQDGVLALSEDHDIVYREDPRGNDQAPEYPVAPASASVSEVFAPSQVMMFRYSALTFNGHRVHYDVDYAREVEGYEGLVFHGPLSATLLAGLACRTVGKPLAAFQFRALAPIAGIAPFFLEGQRKGTSMDLWVRRRDGVMAMQARAVF